jgi:hypothetical protein
MYRSYAAPSSNWICGVGRVIVVVKVAEEERRVEAERRAARA